MFFRYMELFVLAADVGSLSKAAIHANLSVAAVSQQITLLENEIGSPLFIRNNRGVQLTPQGRLFYSDAKIILQQTKRAVQRVKDYSDSAKRLTFGGFGSDTYHVLPSVFLAVTRAYPSALVSIRSINFESIEDELLSSNIDLCFVYGHHASSVHSPLLQYIKLLEDDFLISVPVTSSLSQKKSVCLSDLRSRHLVMIRKGFSASHDLLRAYIQENEPDIHIIDCTEDAVENRCMLHTMECCYLVPKLFDSDVPQRKQLPFSFVQTIPIGIICQKASSAFLTQEIIPLCRKTLKNLSAANRHP